jgi:hypothetical protein
MGVREFDPIALVRATNHLRSLGKDKAIAALRDYTELAPVHAPGSRRADPRNIDTADQQCLQYLVPLVFDDIPQWVKVWQGIPFHTVVIWGSTGQVFSTRPMVEEAAKGGMLRTKPLRPADNPLDAADGLFQKIVDPKDRDEDRGGLREHLRRQAWQAVRHHVDPKVKRSPDFTSQAVWDRLKAEVARLKIHWDEKRQEYVAGEKVK